MSILRHAALAALPFLAGAALAQGAPTPAAAPPKAPQGIPGVSPQGNAIALQKLHQSDAILKQMVLQIRDAGQQLQLEAQRPVINVDLLGALIKKVDGLTAQIRAKQADNVAQALHALPPGDRTPFVRAVILGGPRPANAAPPAH